MGSHWKGYIFHNIVKYFNFKELEATLNLILFFFYFIFKLYIIVLVLPNIKMNPPQVYMCSPSRTLLPPPSPYHPSGLSQCTSPKHPVSCIEPWLATRFIHDILHVSNEDAEVWGGAWSIKRYIFVKLLKHLISLIYLFLLLFHSNLFISLIISFIIYFQLLSYPLINFFFS